MKVKLLKKIRKRYDIKYHENGVIVDSEFIQGPIMVLYDNHNVWRLKASFLDKDKAYQELYNTLLKWIQSDYGNFKSKQRKITTEKLWWGK